MPNQIQDIKPKVSLSKLTFSSGQTIELQPNEKLLLVGPNNSGKSQTLREVVSLASNGERSGPVVISNLELKKQGTSDDLRRFLETFGTRENRSFNYRDWSINELNLELWNKDYLLNDLHKGFIKPIYANTRLEICNQQDAIGPSEKKSAPQHILFDNDDLFRYISGLFKRSFGRDLMFDFRGGKKLPIHVGTIPFQNEIVDRVSDEYIKEVRKQPLLDKEGDGVKSYAGILFEAIVANLDITLIDEPEAFLHPPQMRKLGETLSTEVIGQLIVATHSSDIMRGFLEGASGNVRVLRIRREGNRNIVSEAAPSVIRELWERPVLRYSNALEGLFHEESLICEDDSDCRLINSIADFLASESAEESRWKDVAYIPTGGKAGVPGVAAVLRKVGVPIKAVFDIDFLSDRSLVQRTYEAFGGTWSEISSDWQRLDSAVREGISTHSTEEVKENIKSILNSSSAENLPRKDVVEAMKQTKPWNHVKRFGSRAIPRGDAQIVYSSLKSKLENYGIYLIEVGEIENFAPDIGGHGPSFVTGVLTKKNLGDHSLRELREFVQHVHHGQASVL